MGSDACLTEAPHQQSSVSSHRGWVHAHWAEGEIAAKHTKHGWLCTHAKQAAEGISECILHMLSICHTSKQAVQAIASQVCLHSVMSPLSHQLDSLPLTD